MGTDIGVRHGGETIRGVARGITPDGALEILIADGPLRTVELGEIFEFPNPSTHRHARSSVRTESVDDPAVRPAARRASRSRRSFWPTGAGISEGRARPRRGHAGLLSVRSSGRHSRAIRRPRVCQLHRADRLAVRGLRRHPHHRQGRGDAVGQRACFCWSARCWPICWARPAPRCCSSGRGSG